MRSLPKRKKRKEKRKMKHQNQLYVIMTTLKPCFATPCWASQTWSVISWTSDLHMKSADHPSIQCIEAWNCEIPFPAAKQNLESFYISLSVISFSCPWLICIFNISCSTIMWNWSIRLFLDITCSRPCPWRYCRSEWYVVSFSFIN